MTTRTVYALKVSADWASEVHHTLGQGESRFGWSYVETADLRELTARIEMNGWLSLTPDERDCYQSFLLGIVPDDYLVYINVPTWGQCTIARVTSPYQWRWEPPDFNHRIPVDPNSVRTFGRNDSIVHPALAARLRLQGRWWRIYADPEFDQLLADLARGTPAAPRTWADHLAALSREMAPHLVEIANSIHHTHPNTSLERLLAEVLKAVPGVKEVHRQGGPHDHGADILVVIEEGHRLTTQRQTTCVVQVKSYTGGHLDTGAVEDIRRAFHAHPQASAGLIFSTAETAGSELEAALEKLRTELNKPVTLILGPDLALFVLQFGARLFGPDSAV